MPDTQEKTLIKNECLGSIVPRKFNKGAFLPVTIIMEQI